MESKTELEKAIEEIDNGIYWGFRKSDFDSVEKSWQMIRTKLDENYFKEEFFLMYLTTLYDMLNMQNTTKNMVLMKICNDIKILQKRH